MSVFQVSSKFSSLLDNFLIEDELDHLDRDLQKILESTKFINVYILEPFSRKPSIPGVQIRLSKHFILAAFYMTDYKIYTVLYKDNKAVTCEKYNYTKDISPVFTNSSMLIPHIKYLRSLIVSGELNGLHVKYYTQ